MPNSVRSCASWWRRFKDHLGLTVCSFVDPNSDSIKSGDPSIWDRELATILQISGCAENTELSDKVERHSDDKARDMQDQRDLNAEHTEPPTNHDGTRTSATRITSRTRTPPMGLDYVQNKKESVREDSFPDREVSLQQKH